MNRDRNWIIYASLCAVGWVGSVVRDAATGVWSVLPTWPRKYWRMGANAGANAVRVHWFAVNPADDPANSITPWQWDAAASKWDLSKPEPQYYSTVLPSLCRIANEAGLTFWFCLTDQCGQKYPDYTPVKRNVQGWGAKSGMYDSREFPAIREHVRRCLEVLPLTGRFPDGRPLVVLELGNEIFGNGASDMVAEAIAPLLAERKIPGDQISIGAFTWPRTWDPKTQQYAPAPEFYQLDLCQKALALAYEKKWGEAWATAIRRQAYRPTHSWLESPRFKDRPYGEQHELHVYEYAAPGRQCQSVASIDGTCGDPSDPNMNPADSDDGTENVRPLPGWLYMAAMDLYQRFSAKGMDGIWMQPYADLIPARDRCRIHFEYLSGASASMETQAAGIGALAKAHRDFWGIVPSNVGQYPPEPDPVPDPIPEPEPDPVEPPVTPPPAVKRSAWYWLIPRLSRRFPWVKINFRRWWLTLTGRA